MRNHRHLLVALSILLLAACSSILQEETPPVSLLPSPTLTEPLSSSPGAVELTETAPAAPESSDTPSAEVSSTPEAVITSTDTVSPPTETATIPVYAEFPEPQDYQWNPFLSGLQRPVLLTHAGDGSRRMFILEQAGRILVVDGGILLETPFLDIRERVSLPRNGSYGERGLLGLAFHPRFEENGYFYVNYTDNQDDTVIARYTVAPGANGVDPGSERRLIFVEQPYPNHNGGELAFGPDGYLYIGLGDGGSAGDPLGYGQSLATLLGKILRIDVDSGEPYAIPEDNPFTGLDTRPEIWAYGLRNPWRFSFDRLTGDLFIGDVGQNLLEEIDYLPAGSPGGSNFGWSYFEGNSPYKGSPPAGLVLIPPVAEYGHNLGCSVTGGHIYRGMNLPAWQGVYLYGDYCSGLVWGLARTPDGGWEDRLLFETGVTISSFGEDEGGEIYLVGYSQGTIYRLEEK